MAEKQEKEDQIKNVINNINKKQIMRNETIQLCKGITQTGLSVYKKEKYANNYIKMVNYERMIKTNRDLPNLSKSE